MTYIEKLRELHPNWSEWEFARVITSVCPFERFPDLDRPSNCNGGADLDYICRACWEREYEEPIPYEFEYADEYRPSEKVHVTVIERSTHYYSKVKVYRVRKDWEDRDIWEGWADEADLRKWMKRRVKEK